MKQNYRGIPALPTSISQDIRRPLEAIKANMERITGQVGNNPVVTVRDLQDVTTFIGQNNFPFSSFEEAWEDKTAADWIHREGTGQLSFPNSGIVGGRVLRAEGYCWRSGPRLLPYNPLGLYTLEARVRMTQAPTDGTRDKVYIGVEGIASDGVTLINASGANSYTGQHYIAAAGFELDQVPLGEWVTLKGYFSGLGVSVRSPSINQNEPSPLFNSVVYFRPVFILNANEGDGVMELDYLSVGSNAQGSSVNFSFYQDNEPVGFNVGDIWFDTDDGNHQYYFNGSIWVSVQDQKLIEALSAAANALSAADGKIKAYYQTTPPKNPDDNIDEGDLWFDTNNGNHIYRWEANTWIDAQDSSIAAAISLANDAQTTADGKAIIHYESEAPSGKSIDDRGDLWVDIDNDHRVYVWDGSNWLVAQDYIEAKNIATQALAQAANAQSTADGKIVTYFQDSEPGDGSVGDLWFDTNNANKVYRHNGSHWVSSDDNRIAQAISDAQSAVTIADGKAIVHYQTTAPGGKNASDQGDLWVDTNDSYKLYVWKGAQWVLSQDWSAANQAAQSAATVYTFNTPQQLPRNTDYSGALKYQFNPGDEVGTGYLSVKLGDAESGTRVSFNGQELEGFSSPDNAELWFTFPIQVISGTNEVALWSTTNDLAVLISIVVTVGGIGDPQAILDAQAARAIANDAYTQAQQALANAANAQTTADGKIVAYYQSSEPTNASIGDLWFDTDDGNKIYRFDGSVWLSAQDSQIAQAINNAQSAQTTADGKAKVYYQNFAPTGLMPSDEGDLWVDLDDYLKLYVWNGTNWILAQDWYAASQTANWNQINGLPLDWLTQNLLDLSQWTIGQQGNHGAFQSIGYSSENKVILGVGPYGHSEPLWQCGVDSHNDADGGWNHTVDRSQGFDPKKSYRLTVWAKQTNSNGSIYIGCGDSSTTYLNGTDNTNPYFWYGDLPQNNKWYLLVGIVHGEDYTGPASGITGVYDPVNGQKVLSGTEYMNKSGVSSQVHRAYLYYSTDLTNYAWFARPRMDVLDGNEPTLEALMTANATLNIHQDWNDISGNGLPDDNATQNQIYRQATAPNGTTGDFWYDTDDRLLYENQNGQWFLIANSFDRTSDLVDDAGYALSAQWTNLTGRPADGLIMNALQQWSDVQNRPADNNILNSVVEARLNASVYYQSTQPGSANIGDVWIRSSTSQMYVYRSGGWHAVGASLAITSANIATFIANGAIGNVQIGNAAIGAANIQDGSIVRAKIANAAIGNAQIDNAAINNAKIADLAVSNAKVASLSATKLTAGTIGAHTVNVGDSRIALDGANKRIDIRDTANHLRVRLGNDGSDFGLEVFNSSGQKVFDADGMITQYAQNPTWIAHYPTTNNITYQYGYVYRSTPTGPIEAKLGIKFVRDNVGKNYTIASVEGNVAELKSSGSKISSFNTQIFYDIESAAATQYHMFRISQVPKLTVRNDRVDFSVPANYTSSMRYKKHWLPLSNAEELISNIEGGTAKWRSQKRGHERFICFKAEEVAKYEPLAVGFDEKGRPDSINYNAIVVAQNEVIKKQKEKIEDLEKRLQRIEQCLVDLQQAA
ncbi:hypothetical protein [Pleionea sp. CnH1-48]|uniref:hypothetical protein n=1 Tax=Pleionea sp. CnH1-48 TaxID=2954494 RepID=UPI00209769C7|nr:hypothetical protein [Pleionea sp. CnH1-48]MCO7225930.1 hypothetical protein [Pleionea sp. CnH1-48]